MTNTPDARVLCFPSSSWQISWLGLPIINRTLKSCIHDGFWRGSKSKWLPNGHKHSFRRSRVYKTFRWQWQSSHHYSPLELKYPRSDPWKLKWHPRWSWNKTMGPGANVVFCLRVSWKTGYSKTASGHSRGVFAFPGEASHIRTCDDSSTITASFIALKTKWRHLELEPRCEVLPHVYTNHLLLACKTSSHHSDRRTSIRECLDLCV